MNRLRTLAGISVFWIGLSVVGDAFVSIVVVVAVANAAPPELMATAVGLITFIGIGAGMLVQPIAGALSDAIRPTAGRRGQLLVGAILTVVALALFGGATDLAAVAIAFILVQVAVAVAQAAQQGFIPDIVEQSWRGRAAGAKGFADLTGAFVGFAVLAAVAGPTPGPAIATIAAVVVVTALAAVVLVREPARAGPAGSGTGTRDMAAAVNRAFRLDVPLRDAFVRIVLARFAFLLATFTVGRFLLLIVAERLGLDASSAAAVSATLFGVLTLVTALGSIPAGWIADRRGRQGVMVTGAVVSAAGCVALLAAPTWTSMLLAGGILAIGSAAFATASWAWTTDLVVDGAAARQMGLANIGTAGAAAAAGLFGPVVDATRAIVPGLGFAAALVPAVALFGLSTFLARASGYAVRTTLGEPSGGQPFRPSSIPHPEVPEP